MDNSRNPEKLPRRLFEDLSEVLPERPFQDLCKPCIGISTKISMKTPPSPRKPLSASRLVSKDRRCHRHEGGGTSSRKARPRPCCHLARITYYSILRDTNTTAYYRHYQGGERMPCYETPKLIMNETMRHKNNKDSGNDSDKR